VDLESVLKPHIEATAERIGQHPVVLAVQDTTSLNYSAHPATEGLGPINTRRDGAQGLKLHDTLAFTPEGTPLGVLDAPCCARQPEQAGTSAQRKELPIEQKESAKWLRSFQRVAAIQRLCPNTRLVSVRYRGADIYELFASHTILLSSCRLVAFRCLTMVTRSVPPILTGTSKMKRNQATRAGCIVPGSTGTRLNYVINPIP
jgi:hypothetical protein